MSPKDAPKDPRLSKDFEVTTTAEFGGLRGDFIVGDGQHLDFLDRGVYRLDIFPHPDKETERILLDIENEAVRSLMKSRKIKAMHVMFVFEREEKDA